nr:RT0821/Lpp0805 family surface protein [Mesorhizobium amorphae]
MWRRRLQPGEGRGRPLHRYGLDFVGHEQRYRHRHGFRRSNDPQRGVFGRSAGTGQPGCAWANSATGSRGTITALAETGDASRGRCRQFDVSRESYDGVTMYKGAICMTPVGTWKTQEFKAL